MSHCLCKPLQLYVPGCAPVSVCPNATALQYMHIPVFACSTICVSQRFCLSLCLCASAPVSCCLCVPVLSCYCVSLSFCFCVLQSSYPGFLVSQRCVYPSVCVHLRSYVSLCVSQCLYVPVTLWQCLVPLSLCASISVCSDIYSSVCVLVYAF